MAAAALARRAVTVCALLVLLAAAAAALAVAAVLSTPVCLPARGRWRAVRLAGFGVAYLALDVWTVACAAAIWVRCARPAPDREQRREQLILALAERSLGRMYAAGRRAFGLRAEIAADGAALRDAAPGGISGPVLVLCRHGGPGDTLLLVYALLAYSRRRPAIVLKRMLMLDPWVDILLARIPHVSVRPGGDDQARAIGALAARLEPRDALVLFPEGGNFTPERRQTGIARLRQLGHPRQAARAARMRHVLAPHPAGTLAALAAAPGADVVIVAHAGLGHLYSFAEIWRGLPLRRPLRVTWWTVPSAAIPPGDQARTRWLFDQWAQVDRWIAAQAAAPAGPAREGPAMDPVP